MWFVLRKLPLVLLWVGDCSVRPGYGIRIFSAIGKQLLTNLEKPGTLKNNKKGWDNCGKDSYPNFNLITPGPLSPVFTFPPLTGLKGVGVLLTPTKSSHVIMPRLF